MLVLLSLVSCFKRRTKRCPMPWRVIVLQEVGLVLLLGGDLVSKAAELGFTPSSRGPNMGSCTIRCLLVGPVVKRAAKWGRSLTAVFAGRCLCTAGDWLCPGRASNCISIGCLLPCLMDEGSISP